MCGIAGGVGRRVQSREVLSSQIQEMIHRGPDDSGFFFGEKVSLGMCRLAIVEIDSGSQPASHAQEDVHIVWNGEIFNYRELRTMLEQIGVKCRTNSESEVIINLFLAFGLDFVTKLNGMFSIAIYDGRDKSLILIRDRMGKKPLWYTEITDRTIFFASEVKALLIARPDRTFRSDVVSEVMTFGYVNSPNSSFNEIHQLPPGSILTWKNEELAIRKYWEPSYTEETGMSYPEALERTKVLIKKAVSDRMIAERPLGSFLSGGFDSTVVTAYMSELSQTKVQTFSIGFKDKRFNEADHAKKVADFLGTEHHEMYIDPDPLLIVEDLSKLMDQPFADQSIIPTYLLSKFAKEHITVALGGDGGDEVFSGYDRYLGTPLMQFMNPLLPAINEVAKLGSKFLSNDNRKFNRILSQLAPSESIATRYSAILTNAKPLELESLITSDFLTHSAHEKFVSDFNQGDLSPHQRMIRSDLNFYLPGDLLYKADMASMGNSLELRSPLLDVNVVEWGLSLPRSYKIKNFETKHILKDVARSLVPKKLIDRPKMGFAIPRANWLRYELKDLVHDTLLDSTALQRGWFKPSEVRKVVEGHMRGEDRDHLIWPMLMLELWARNWLD
jgi:asparagine synthase (glutamine-hydrolysing)